jgi:hypothetical protein
MKWTLVSLAFLVAVVGAIAIIDRSDAAAEETTTTALAVQVAQVATFWDHSEDWDQWTGSEANVDGMATLWVLGGVGATSAELWLLYSGNVELQKIAGVIQDDGIVHFTSDAVEGAHVISATVFWNGELVPIALAHTLPVSVTIPYTEPTFETMSTTTSTTAAPAPSSTTTTTAPAGPSSLAPELG